MVGPVFQVPGLEHVSHQPEEPLVIDLFRQDRKQDLMIQRPVAVRDVSLDEPHGPGPGIAYLPQRGVAPTPFPEPVRPARERRLVIRLQQEPYHLADELAGPVRQAEGPELPVLLRDVDAACRREPVLFVPHQLDDLVDLPPGHAVSGFPAGPGRHRPLVGIDVPVRQQVQILVEHLPVQLRERQAPPAALAENAQHHYGFLHCASLMAADCSSPVPLRPVDRPSRSPDWPDVTPATTTGTPSPSHETG